MARKPRIFHGVYNVAGIPAALAEAERAKGYESRAFGYDIGVYQRRVDEVITGTSPALFAAQSRAFDIFNFHFGVSLLGPNLEDLPLLRAMGKKVFMHFHGCDIRDSKSVIEKYPISACMECWPMQCSPNRNLARTMAQKYASQVFVSTPDIVEFVKNAILLPQAIDTADILAIVADAAPYQPRPDRIVVAHAPSATSLKGTRFVEQAVDTLKAAGIPIELRLLTGMPHAEVIKAIHESDIFVDQILAGTYGVAAIEAMVLKKPVVAYIRDDLAGYYGPDLPMLSASPLNIVDVLYDLSVKKQAEWAQIGARGMDYVSKVHTIEVISDRLCDYYK